jgi:uncharacterized protein
MNILEDTSFQANGIFNPVTHFPYGLARSGEFNRLQVQLLEKHGKAYEALHMGQRAPVNEEEAHFLAVCRGDTEAETDHERAWMRYCLKIQKKTSISLFGSSQKANAAEEIIEEPLSADDFD